MTDTRTINELVNDALMKWVAVTGVDLSKTSWTIRIGDDWSDYQVTQITEELNTSRELDDTGLTTFMMLRGITDLYLQDQTVSFYDLIVNPAQVRERLKELRELRDLVEDPLVLELIEDFVVKVRETAKEFEFKDTEGLEKLLADKYKLAHVRRDALLSMEKLSAHQFTQGTGDPLPIRFNPHVWEFWNVNSLVRALRDQQVPGISTVLIRDPDAVHSFFVFGIKNGDVITVLTDKDEEAHPAAKRMSRRPERKMWERAAKHWFPYQLLDYEVKGKRMTFRQRQGLVPIDAVGFKMTHIGELEPAQFVWTILMYERLRDKFWKQNYQLSQLSYTGEMVVEPESLIGSTSALVRAGLYAPIVLTPLTAADVTSETTAEQWRRQPTYFYDYMVERYAAKVPVAVFNVVGENQLKRLQGSLKLIGKDHFGDPTELVKLETLDPQNFGSREKLVEDRLWAARYNQMRMIQRAAEQEYERDREKIAAWWVKAVKANAEALLNACARGELVLPVWYGRGNPEQDRDTPFPSKPRDPYVVEINGLKQYSGRHARGLFHYQFRSDAILGYWNERPHYPTCYERAGVRASIFTEITPTCPEALAIIVGKKVEDLPWPLQHWHPEWAGEPYNGNCILDRTDPVDWILKDPWRGQRYSVLICLCKRAIAARRKALGLDPTQYPPTET